MRALIRRIEPSLSTPNQTGALGSPVLVEVTIDERHGKRADITRHPVEDGLDVSDFIRTGPLQLAMTLAFSNQPLKASTVPDGIFAGNNQSRISSTWDAFLNLIDGRPRRSLFRITTGLKLYDNMALESITTGQNSDNPDSIVIRARFTEVRVVRSDFQALPARQFREGEAQQRGQGDVQQGEQHADDLPVCSACEMLCEQCLVPNPQFTIGVDDMPEMCGDNCEPEFRLDDGCAEDQSDRFAQITDSRNADSEAAVRALCEMIRPEHLLDRDMFAGPPRQIFIP